MALDSQGAPAVAAAYDLAPPGETDSTGAAVAMYSTTGQETWRTAFTGSGDVRITALDFDGGDNLLAIGSFTGSLEAGSQDILDDPEQRAFLARLNSSGDVGLLTWFGGAHSVTAEALTAHPSGDCIVAGSFEGTEKFGSVTLTSADGNDIFVARVSPGGNVLWAKRFGGAGSQHVGALSVDTKGNVGLAGGFSGQVSFGGSTLSGLGIGGMYVAMLDGDGEHVWSRGFDTDTLDIAFDMEIGSDDGVAVVGSTYGDLDLGLGFITNSGAADGLAMKIAP
jgi:hypothetical protein